MSRFASHLRHRNALAVSILCTSAMVSGQALAGAVNGPSASNYVVAPNQSDALSVTFRAGDPARVTIVGDGDTDLVLQVFDRDGRRMCRAVGAGDIRSCRFRASQTAPYRVEVTNIGDQPNVYFFAHN
jgi:hypothetical protein